MVTLLLTLVLNQQRWLQIHSMQVLKLLFQQRETRNPFELLGPELLMPLLRLLETDLAMQALDVLEEPMILSNRGPTAKHVLRMSMHIQTLQNCETATAIFGVPKSDGVFHRLNRNETCRAKSRVDDLSGLVKDLHDLTIFFQQEPSRARKPPLTPNQRLEVRVAAILAKFTAAAMVTDIPQTPFLDVFNW